MGLTQSSEYTNYENKISNSDIRRNIDNLFKNRSNTMDQSEATFSLGNMENYQTDDNQMTDTLQMGGRRKFRSSHQRYLNHNIEAYVNAIQSGGNPKYNQNDDMSELNNLNELDKIKEYIINDMKNQTGGNMYDLSSNDEMDNSNYDSNVLLNKLLATQYGGDTDDEDMSTDEEEDEEEDEDNAIEEEEEDDDDEDEEEDDEEDEDDEDKNVASEGSLSSTSSAIVSRIKSLSSTSYSQTNKKKKHDSDLNIVPFYSSDVSVPHPYVRRRFN